jgi:hypothetical protein
MTADKTAEAAMRVLGARAPLALRERAGIDWETSDKDTGHERLAESALQVLGGAARSQDPEERKDAIRTAVVTLREIDARDPALLVQLGMSREELEGIARDVGLAAAARDGLSIETAVQAREIRLSEAMGMDREDRRAHNANVPLLEACGIDPDDLNIGR